MPDIGDTLSNRFEWILVTGAFGAFLYGYATGSNDVANAFGTSVGAKTLTLKQAVLLAAIFEFTGAIVLGRVSAETIAGGIAKQSAFVNNPPAFAYGMSVVLWIGGICQLIASYLGLNVSATHCIIGGLIGFAMAYGGSDAVFWAEPDKTKNPPIKGAVPIILSWFISPLLTGACSAVIYGLNVFFVLRHKNSAQRACWVLPILVFCTVTIDVYFVFTKGAKKTLVSSAGDWSDNKAAWIAAIIGAGCSLIASVIGIPFLQRKIRQKIESRDMTDGKDIALEGGDSSKGQNSDSKNVLMMVAQNGELAFSTLPVPTRPVLPVQPVGYNGHISPPNYYLGNAPSQQNMNHGNNFGLPLQHGMHFGIAPVQHSVHVNSQNFGMPSKKDMVGIRDASMRGLEYDVHKKIVEDPVVAAIHAHATVWDEDTEFIFGFLQVISAICVIFAHGAGEVGYMAGPLAVIYNVVSNPGNNVVSNGTKVVPEIWIILISAFGLVFGLATYGYKVVAAVGTQMAMITPSRGFAAELATSFIIMIAAQLGLPTSSSQCITGGIIGVALFEGSKGVNIKFLATTMSSWVITTVGMAIVCAAFFSQAVYAPSIYHEYRYSKNLTMTYDSLCTRYYSCKGGQYLKDCGFKDGDPVHYNAGSCTDCKTCKQDQYLKGCGMLSSGTCTNCTKTVCPVGQILYNCSGLKAGVCAAKK